MMNKTLVAYFTKGGASEEYAKIIAETLSTKGLSVEIQNLAYDVPDVAAFDTIVLGTGVRMGMVYRRWRKVLNQKPLRDKRLFIYIPIKWDSYRGPGHSGRKILTTIGRQVWPQTRVSGFLPRQDP